MGDCKCEVRGKCETLEGVREFHEAFGVRVEPHPVAPDLRPSEAAEIGSIAREMELIADRCHRAAEATRLTSRPASAVFLRLQLLQEELSELARAMQKSDILDSLDALTDIQYVLDGSYLSLGLQDLKLPAFREVQRSNMTKLGADGRPIINEAGRVVKGPNYQPPRLKELLYKLFYMGKVE